VGEDDRKRAGQISGKIGRLFDFIDLGDGLKRGRKIFVNIIFRQRPVLHTPEGVAPVGDKDPERSRRPSGVV